MMALGLGFSASQPRRKLAFHTGRHAALDQNGDFCSAALAHLAGLAKLYAAGE
jgi:hypothetical protein